MVSTSSKQVFMVHVQHIETGGKHECMFARKWRFDTVVTRTRREQNLYDLGSGRRSLVFTDYFLSSSPIMYQ